MFLFYVLSVHFVFFVMRFLVHFQPVFDMKWKNDQCFHNYACAEPLWIFASFNHVFSNLGYALSGTFFLIFARMRKKKPTVIASPFFFILPLLLYNRTILLLFQLGYGIHANYGIELSMGLSLLCEALASSIYHICPNSTTYNLGLLNCEFAELQRFRHSYLFLVLVLSVCEMEVCFLH